MSMMVDILKEEKERLIQLIHTYEKEIATLPTGCISWKRRGEREYAYRAFRQINSVRFEYLGKRGSDKVDMVADRIRRRQELERKRRDAVKNLKQIERMLRAAGTTS